MPLGGYRLQSAHNCMQPAELDRVPTLQLAISNLSRKAMIRVTCASLCPVAETDDIQSRMETSLADATAPHRHITT